MNKRIDFSFLGGFPFDENTLAFMQDSYRGALGALAKLCGDKTILAGVEVIGSNVTAGWISYGGELIPFIGGAVAAQVKITETAAPLIFEDNASHDVEFVKVAELVAVGGDLDFAELLPLKTILKNKIELNTATDKLALITHYISHFETNYPVGDIINDKVLTISMPNQQTSDYVVGGSLRGLNNDPNQDNDQMWIVADKTPTSFKLAIREVPGAGVQNLVFDYTITKPF